MSPVELALAHQCTSLHPPNSPSDYVGNLHIIGHEEHNWIISLHGKENLEWMLESREAQRRLFHAQLTAIKDKILYVLEKLFPIENLHCHQGKKCELNTFKLIPLG